MKQKNQIFLIYCLFISLVVNACSVDNTETSENKSGVVLSFDDYFPETWIQNFDMFDKYNAKVTFFVTGNHVTQFMIDAQERGHEIGYHTIYHLHLPKLTREQFWEETIPAINVFRESGIELTSFAYPYGKYSTWMHNELLEYYKIVRGFSKFRLYDISDMKSRFVYSKSIDNITYKSEKKFQKGINRMLQSAKKSGKILLLTSHRISGADYGITPERLEYVLERCKEYGLMFYTYKDLQ